MRFKGRRRASVMKSERGFSGRRRIPDDFTAKRRLMVIICFSIIMCLFGRDSTAQDLKKGDVRYVSCHNLPVHQSPNAFSSILGFLPYSFPVTVLEIESAAAKDKTPLWIKISYDQHTVGFIHGACLISDRLLKKQNEGRGSVNEEDLKVSGKGFSESEEKVDLYAMKGAAGSSKTGKADYAALNAVLETPAEKNFQTRNRDFRSQGMIAEFRSKDRKPSQDAISPVIARNTESTDEKSVKGNDDATQERSATLSKTEVTEESLPKSGSSYPEDIRDSERFDSAGRQADASRSPESRMYPLSLEEIYQLLKAFRNINPQRCLEFSAWAIEIDPKHAAVYNERGYAFVSLGNLYQACQSFQKGEQFGDAFGIKWARSKGLCR